MRAYNLDAINIARNIDLIEIEKELKIEVLLKKRRELILKKGSENFVFIYFFGAVVFFNVTKEEQKKIISDIMAKAGKVAEERVYETYQLVIGKADSVDFDIVTIDKFSLKKISIIAYILAQSVAIERLENVVEKKLKKIEELNQYFQTKSITLIRNKEIFPLIGEISNVIGETIANLSLLDKPDILWDYKGLEKLFTNCRKMFELDTRFANLKFKVDYIQNNLKTITDIMTNRKLELLEWAILILIFIEILIYVYDIVFL